MTGFGTLNSDADMALVFDPNVNTIPKKKSRNVISRLASCLRRQGELHTFVSKHVPFLCLKYVIF